MSCLLITQRKCFDLKLRVKELFMFEVRFRAFASVYQIDRSCIKWVGPGVLLSPHSAQDAPQT